MTHDERSNGGCGRRQLRQARSFVFFCRCRLSSPVTPPSSSPFYCHRWSHHATLSQTWVTSEVVVAVTELCRGGGASPTSLLPPPPSLVHSPISSQASSLSLNLGAGGGGDGSRCEEAAAWLGEGNRLRRWHHSGRGELEEAEA